MQRIDLEQIAAALRLLQRTECAREEDSEARSLLHAVLNRHGHELDDFRPPADLEQARARIVAEIESGFGDLQP